MIAKDRWHAFHPALVEEPEPERVRVSKNHNVDLYEWDEESLCIVFPWKLNVHNYLLHRGIEKAQSSDYDVVLKFGRNWSRIDLVLGAIISKIPALSLATSQRIPLTGHNGPTESATA